MHRKHYVPEEEGNQHFVTINYGCDAELKEVSDQFKMTQTKKEKEHKSKNHYYIGGHPILNAPFFKKYAEQNQ